MRDEMVIPKLQPMTTAPKDGTEIIIVWYNENMDIRKYNIRIAKWWIPTEPQQTAKPHWEYINDKDSCMSIHNPNGWILKPELLG